MTREGLLNTLPLPLWVECGYLMFLMRRHFCRRESFKLQHLPTNLPQQILTQKKDALRYCIQGGFTKAALLQCALSSQSTPACSKKQMQIPTHSARGKYFSFNFGTTPCRPSMLGTGSKSGTWLAGGGAGGTWRNSCRRSSSLHAHEMWPTATRTPWTDRPWRV